MKSLYNTSNVLAKMHPYDQDATDAQFLDHPQTVFHGFGVHGMERNIDALQDDAFNLQEKKKALKILQVQMASTENRLRCAQELHLSASLVYLFEQQFDEECNKLAAILAQLLAIINPGKQALFDSCCLPLLFTIVQGAKSVQHSDRIAACKAIRLLAESQEGAWLLIREAPQVQQECRIVKVLMQVMQEMLTNNTIQHALLLEVIQTLYLLTDISKARHFAATNNCLSLLATLIKNVIIPEANTFVLVTAFSQHKCTLALAKLIWNLTLDGAGQALAKNQIWQESIQLLHLAREMQNEQLVHEMAGAFGSMLIDRDTKFLSIAIVEQGYHLIHLLAQLLVQMEQEQSLLASETRSKVITALRLASQYPKAREAVLQELDSMPPLLLQIFAETNLFMPHCTTSPDLLPSSNKYAYLYKK